KCVPQARRRTTAARGGWSVGRFLAGDSASGGGDVHQDAADLVELACFQRVPTRGGDVMDVEELPGCDLADGGVAGAGAVEERGAAGPPRAGAVHAEHQVTAGPAKAAGKDAVGHQAQAREDTGGVLGRAGRPAP